MTTPDPTRLVDGYYHLPPPAELTDAMPGTPEKVEVLRRRVERGEGLWHEGDAGMAGRRVGVNDAFTLVDEASRMTRG